MRRAGWLLESWLRECRAVEQLQSLTVKCPRGRAGVTFSGCGCCKEECYEESGSSLPGPDCSGMWLSDSASFRSFLAIDPRVLNSVSSSELPTLAFPQPLSMVIEKEVATSHSPLVSTHKAKRQTLYNPLTQETTRVSEGLYQELRGRDQYIFSIISQVQYAGYGLGRHLFQDKGQIAPSDPTFQEEGDTVPIGCLWILSHLKLFIMSQVKHHTYYKEQHRHYHHFRDEKTVLTHVFQETGKKTGVLGCEPRSPNKLSCIFSTASHGLH
ncbi:uncharacterized protein LOC125106957 [Lutra lutra]|uniref:uncharacterized protein LOC125106957 n=1 Tax=Lutra lutra TaxID=9657 RepID=UPI001FD3D11B|nr:uncharacterized protein LOC125106957 [Lutra lutra]